MLHLVLLQQDFCGVESDTKMLQPSRWSCKKDMAVYSNMSNCCHIDVKGCTSEKELQAAVSFS